MRIGKTATDPSIGLTPSLFYDSAREGMRDFLEYCCRGERRRILLPAYIGWSPIEGSGVFDPVRELALEPYFYELNSDLSVNRTDFERRLTESAPQVVVLIHYFGRTQPELAELARLARGHGAVVVEDLAHGFFTARRGGAAGRHGDVLLFSLHKMFATPGARGGLVTYRDPQLLRGQSPTRPEFASFLMNYDWDGIANTRRSNFTVLNELLLDLPSRGLGFDLIWPMLSVTDVPQTLPVRILNGNRDKIYHRMNSDGFGMVSLYHTLIPEVRAVDVAVELAESTINFPVHQDIDPGSICGMVASFERALSLEARQ